LKRHILNTVFFVFYAITLHSQTAPDAFNGLELWLKSDAGITLEGNNVLLWEDQSGNNNDASVFAGSLRPSWVADVLNGFPAVRFDGSNDFLDFTEINNVRTVFWVIKEDVTADSVYPRCLLGHYSQYDFLRGPSKVMWHPTLSAPEVRDGITRVNFQQIDGTTSLVPTDFSIISLATTGNTSASSIVVDRQLYERVWDGDLLELILFSEVLDPAQIEQVELYLADRYGPEFYALADVQSNDSFCPIEICAAPGFESYQWSNGAITECTEVNNTGLYTLEVQDLFGRIIQDTVYAQFPGNTEPDSVLICEGQAYTWDTNLDEVLFTIQWPDLSSESTFTSTEEGSIDLLITDEFGCTVNTYIYVEVDDFPVQVSLGSDVELCSGNTITITPESDMPVSWLWNTGSEEDALLITESGDYSLIAQNENDCIAYDTVTVDVIGVAPEITFIADQFCEESLTFFEAENLSGSTITDWIWSYGDLSSGGGMSSSHTYLSAGEYDVLLEAVSVEGCSGFYEQSIIIHSIPSIAFELPSPCNNETFELESGASSLDGEIISYEWEINDISTNGNLVEYGPLVSGFHDVVHTVVSEYGCISTLQLPVQVLSAPQVDYTVDGVCLGNLTYFVETIDDSQSGPIQNYAWLFDDGTGSFLASPSHFYSQEGDYSVRLIALAQNGCRDTMIQVVTVLSPPIIDFSTLNACIGQPQAFAAEVETGYVITSYDWILEDVDISTDQFWYYTFDAEGLYSMSLEVTTQEGCISAITQSIPVWPKPEAVFTFSPQIGAAPLYVEYDATGSTGTQYEWFFGDGPNAFGFDMSHTYTTNGSYVIALVTTNDYGCTDTAYTSILIAEPVLDIVVEQISCDNAGRPIAWLVNNSNFKVRHMRLQWQQGGDSPITEWWDGVLNPGQLLVYQFESGMSQQEGNDPYVCITAEANQTGFTETNEVDNVRCKALSTDVFELYNLFYTGANEVTLRYVVPGDGDIGIELIGSSGTRIQSAEIKGEKAGLHTYNFDVHGLASGSYIASVRWKDKIRSIHFFVQ
jgi:PKD repeat protein